MGIHHQIQSTRQDQRIGVSGRVRFHSSFPSQTSGVALTSASFERCLTEPVALRPDDVLENILIQFMKNLRPASRNLSYVTSPRHLLHTPYCVLGVEAGKSEMWQITNLTRYLGPRTSKALSPITFPSTCSIRQSLQYGIDLGQVTRKSEEGAVMALVIELNWGD